MNEPVESVLQKSLKRIKSEAEWGLSASRTHPATCNAQKALKIVIILVRQAMGEKVDNPISL
jgi:hypothetical protein